MTNLMNALYVCAWDNLWYMFEVARGCYRVTLKKKLWSHAMDSKQEQL